MSACCFLLGWILIAGSPAFTMFGDRGRYASLGLGGMLLAGSAIFSGYYCVPRRAITMVLGSLFFIIFAELLLFQNEQDPTSMLSFRLVIYLFFFSGLFLGIHVKQGYGSLQAVGILVLMATAASLALLYLHSRPSLQDADVGRLVADEALDPVGVAFSFGVIAALFLPCLLFSRLLWIRAGSCVVMGACLLCVMSTGSRGALLSLAVVLAIFLALFCFFGREYSRRFRVVTVLLVALMLAGMTAYSIARSPDQFQFIADRFILGAGSQLDLSQEERVEKKEYYYRKFDRWWLGGYSNYQHDYPHNLFVEFFVRFGLFGLVLVGIFLAFLPLGGLALVQLRFGLFPAMILSGAMFNFFNAMVSLELEFDRYLIGGLGFLIGYYLYKAPPWGARELPDHSRQWLAE